MTDAVFKSSSEEDPKVSTSVEQDVTQGAEVAPTGTEVLGDKLVKLLVEKKWGLRDLEVITGIKAETWFKLIRGTGTMAPVIPAALVKAFPETNIADWTKLCISSKGSTKHAGPKSSCNFCNGLGKVTFIRANERVEAPCPRCLKSISRAMNRNEGKSRPVMGKVTIRPNSVPTPAEVELARMKSVVTATELSLSNLMDARSTILKEFEPEANTLLQNRIKLSAACRDASYTVEQIAGGVDQLQLIIEENKLKLEKLQVELEGAMEHERDAQSKELELSAIEENIKARINKATKDTDLRITKIKKQLIKAKRRVDQLRSRLELRGLINPLEFDEDSKSGSNLEALEALEALETAE